MKVSYRGYEIDAHRAESLGGDTLLYWSIFREHDQREMDSGFTTGSDSTRTYVQLLKERVDEELADADEELDGQTSMAESARYNAARFVLRIRRTGEGVEGGRRPSRLEHVHVDMLHDEVDDWELLNVVEHKRGAMRERALAWRNRDRGVWT